MTMTLVTQERVMPPPAPMRPGPAAAAAAAAAGIADGMARRAPLDLSCDGECDPRETLAQFEARLRCNDATERRLRKRPVQHALAGLERISMIGRGGFGCAAPAWVAGEVRADCRSKP